MPCVECDVVENYFNHPLGESGGAALDTEIPGSSSRLNCSSTGIVTIVGNN
jgi:hypothetical protein